MMDSSKDLKSSYRNYIPHEPKATFVDTRVESGEDGSSIVNSYFSPQAPVEEDKAFSPSRDPDESNPEVISLVDQIKDPDHPNIYLP